MQIPLICQEEAEAFSCQFSVVYWLIYRIMKEYLHLNDFKSFVIVQ